MTNKQRALMAAERGWHVFPLNPATKLPAITGWQDWATTDRSKIEAQWTKYPKQGVGILCGKSNLFVIDVDVKNGNKGPAELFDLEMDNGALPPTFRVRTPSGGFHLYFQADKPLRGPKLSKGIDTRGHGQLVAFSSNYEIEADVPVAPLPQSWSGIAKAPRDREVIRQTGDFDDPDMVDQATDVARTEPPAVEGDRNNHLFRLACRLKDYGISPGLNEALIEEHWNSRCIPPIDKEELRKTIESAYQNSDLPAGSNNPKNQFEAAEGDFEPVVAASSVGNLVFFGDNEDDSPEPDPLIEGIMDKGSCVLLYGRSNVGKTFVGYAMARAIAKGAQYAGREVEQGPVLYIHTEGHAGMRRRRKALRQHHGDRDLPMAFMAASVNIRLAGDRQAIADAIEATRQRFGQNPALVVVDTLSAATPGMDENQAGEISAALSHLRRLTCAHGITLMLVHHAGKSEASGPRGSSALIGNVDTVIRVADGLISSDKEREAAKLDPIPFSLKVIEVGSTLKGRKVTSCVAICHAPSEKDFGAVPMTTAEKEVFDGLARLQADMELLHDGESNYIARNAINDHLSETKGFVSRATVRRQVSRCLVSLRDKGYVRNNTENQWVINSETE